MTIEERAKASFRSFHDKALFPVHLDGYRSGATDQRKIDMEKTCDWLKWLTNGETRVITPQSVIESYLKAMES